MPTIQPDQLGDLVAGTLRDLGRMKVTDLSTDLQRHTALKIFSKKGNYKTQIDSGYGMQWNILMNPSANTRNVGWFETVNLNVMDGMVQANVPWRNMTGGYAIEHREITANGGASKIVDILQERRMMHMVDWSEKFEANFWNAPSATSTTDWYGLPYWVTKNATAGFTGGLLSGYSSCAGLSPTTYPRWNNYAAPYTNISKDDLLRAWAKAADFTDFLPPVDDIVASFDTNSGYGFYTNYSVYQGLKEALEDQNEDLGADLDSQNGRAVFRKVPITWIPKLDADTTNPIYGINWGVFKMAVLKGWWQKEQLVNETPGQPTVMSVYVNTTGNFLCRDRRKQFVLSNGVTYPS